MILFLFCFFLFVMPCYSVSPRNFPIIPFDEGYTPLFGDHNLIIHSDSKAVHLLLDESSGSSSSTFIS